MHTRSGPNHSLFQQHANSCPHSIVLDCGSFEGCVEGCPARRISVQAHCYTGFHHRDPYGCFSAKEKTGSEIFSVQVVLHLGARKPRPSNALSQILKVRPPPQYSLLATLVGTFFVVGGSLNGRQGFLQAVGNLFFVAPPCRPTSDCSRHPVCMGCPRPRPGLPSLNFLNA